MGKQARVARYQALPCSWTIITSGNPNLDVASRLMALMLPEGPTLGFV